jgi:hypothetical protein
MTTTTATDDIKVAKLIDKIIKLLNKSNLNIPELIVLYGNLGYHIGASIAGVSTKEGPTVEELRKLYYQRPTVDVGLMLQGLMITDWEKDFLQTPQLSSLVKKQT